MAFSDYHQRT
jgi:monovalent cation:H+ antiporter-2, CPA2 family